MLIQLTVKNFRSIRDEQTIDFYAPIERDELSENTVAFPEAGIRVLRAVGLYGGNAAGKSTMFMALSQIIDIIMWEGCKPDGNIPFYDPYRLNEKTKSQPTSFSLEFALPIEGLAPYRRYLFAVSFNKDKIVSESLEAFDSKGRSLSLYSRRVNDTYKTIKLGRALQGGRRRIPFFANQSYLAVAWKTADSPKMLRTISAYLCGGIKLHNSSHYDSVDQGSVASALLPYADVGISKVIDRKRGLDADRIATMQKYLSKEELEKTLRSMTKEREQEYLFEHRGNHGEMGIIKLDEESEGTQRLFASFPRLLDVLDKGLTWLEDEIDTHMHPYLVELLMRLFNDPEVNVNNAQLFFSTHNMGLLSERLLRKDQIWFAEKRDGATEVFSLQDFDDKKVFPSSPYAQWYMEGRFGGVPSLDYLGFVRAIKSLQKTAKETKNA